MGADDDIGALNATTTAEKIEPDAGKPKWKVRRWTPRGEACTKAKTNSNSS